ncbi:MAG: hypothetical protein AAF234_20365 [Pseudomonadota bacterium]
MKYLLLTTAMVPVIYRAPADTPPAATPPAETPPPATPPAETPPAATPPAGSDKPWYDTREWSDPTLKEFAVKNGYHSGTADEALEKALKGEMTAAAKLGKDPKSLVELPGEDGSIMDFFKDNGAKMGVPDSIEKYELSLPSDLPEGLPIDQALLDGFTKASFEAGLPPAVAQASVDFYAAHVTNWMSEQQGKVAESEKALETALKSKWGGNWEENRDLGVRAFQTLAAKIGLDADATKNVASKLNEGMGDVHLVQFTHGLAEIIGEDSLAKPRNSDAPAANVATATQRKAQIMAKGDGDMAKARGNPARIKELQKELEGLNRIIAAG